MKRLEEFSNLRNAGFDKTYSHIHKALKYYENDPEICCSRFRHVLESVIDDLYKITGRRKDSTWSTLEHINHLHSILPYFDGQDAFITEMHILRTIGNKYNHNMSEDADPVKDRYTCYFATRNLAEMMVSLSHQISEKRKCMAEDQQTRKEAEKKWLEERKKIRAAEAAAKQKLEKTKVESRPEPEAGYRSVNASQKSGSKVKKSPKPSSKPRKSDDKKKLWPILAGVGSIALGAITYIVTKKK